MVSGIKFDDAKNERTHYLRNSSNSPDCNVNGSGTPVHFDFTVQ